MWGGAVGGRGDQALHLGCNWRAAHAQGAGNALGHTVPFGGPFVIQDGEEAAQNDGGCGTVSAVAVGPGVGGG